MKSKQQASPAHEQIHSRVNSQVNGLCYFKAVLPTAAPIVLSIKATDSFNSKAGLQLPYLALQFLQFKWSISTPFDVSDAKIDTDAPSA